LTYKINFDEPIPQMADRLKKENVNLNLSFEKIEKFVNENEIKQTLKSIHDISESIIRHAVEEDARIMRVIMQKAKEESAESIKIMQEHNWVVDFLKQKLQNIENKIHQQELQQEQTQEYNDQQQQEIKKQIKLLEKMYLDDDKK
jgi:hypothetical protein